MFGLIQFVVFISLMFSSVLQAAILAPVKPLQSLVVFGASLSDTGRAWHASGYTKPAGPYYFGRYSNGPVWVEYVAKARHLTQDQVKNYAFAEAKIQGITRAVTHDPKYPKHVWSYAVPDLPAEVTAYLHDQPNISPLTTVVIFMGANDLLQSVATKQSPQELVRRMTDVLFKQVQRLHQHGAKTIIIFDLPNIAATPWYHGAKKNTIKLKQFIDHINQLWRKKAKQSGVAVFSVSQFMQNFFSDMKAYGEVSYHWQNRKTAFKPQSLPCYQGNNYIDWRGRPCLDHMSYLFFDRLHPTTQGHAYLADAFMKWYKKIN